MRKILIIVLFFLVFVSCGKKGDPEYKGSNKGKVLIYFV
tara:strand:- start:13324 stop:13440 length:117 start_codon:yes stop_codon:yes gene_type:complete